MTIIGDTSFVYAAYNPDDTYHEAAASFGETNTEPVIVPDVILPELGFLFERDLGYSGVVKFFDQFRHVGWRLVPMLNSDLQRVFEIAERYANAELDVVDCCIIALAERLQITRIATFDRRDFGIVRPRHTPFFDLLP